MNNPSNKRTPPKRVTIKRTKDGITIVRRWLNWGTLHKAVFVIIWDTIIITQIIPLLLLPEVFGFLILAIFLLASIWLTYVAFVEWFNKTQIVANDREIIVSYGPLPMLRQENKQLKASKLKRLYSYEKRTSKENVEYQVRAETHTGADKKMVTLGRRREALFVIQTLEDYFNIPNESRDG